MINFNLNGRKISLNDPPLVIAEIGINHEGDENKAHLMIDAVADSGGECVKFQTHIVDDEMIKNDVIPPNADEPIYNMMERCALSYEAEMRLKTHAEEKGLIFLSTPFSRAAVDRLEKLGVPAYKIGSGECNNYPLVEYIASKGKPVIMSTGMNDMFSIDRSVNILNKYSIPFALLHCISIYPTEYNQIQLGAIKEISDKYPDIPVGFSDHSTSIYPCLAAVALGACILERHFTVSRTWPGPDIPVSMTPDELQELIKGSRIIAKARGGKKEILPGEIPTSRFAYASVVAVKNIPAGTKLTKSNIWVKRPGTGEILADSYDGLIGKRVNKNISKNEQLRWDLIE